MYFLVCIRRQYRIRIRQECGEMLRTSIALAKNIVSKTRIIDMNDEGPEC